MLIPGTHNSHSYKHTDTLVCKDSYTLNQEKDLYEQLKGGIRFLDLRLYDDSYFSHFICKTTPISEGLQAIGRFMQENPTELILV